MTYKCLKGIRALFFTRILALVGATALLAGFGGHLYVLEACGVVCPYGFGGEILRVAACESSPPR